MTLSPAALIAKVNAALDDFEFFAEVAAVDRLGRELAARGAHAHPEEVLGHRRRRARLLAEVADRTGLAEDRELAVKAQASVEALMAGVD